MRQIIKNLEKNNNNKLEALQVQTQKLEDQIHNLKNDAAKSNELLTKEIDYIKKLEEQLQKLKDQTKYLEDKLKKSNDLLTKEKDEKKILEGKINKLEAQIEKLKESNDFLFSEIGDMKKKNLADESYRYMKDLNIQMVLEGFAFNNRDLDCYKNTNDLEKLKIELVQRDLKIRGLERLLNVFSEDLLVKGTQIEKLKEEIEGLKKAKI